MTAWNRRELYRIGFVGLGAMGLPMAKNLVARGFAVRGYDIRAEPRAALSAAGGVAVESPAGAFESADAVVLMVVDATQAESVLSGEGALAALAPGTVVILMATAPPQRVVAIAERVQAAGYGFVDAPVSGGVVGAEAGTLTIMAAGDRDAITRIGPLLRAVGGKIVTVGSKPGQGATAKAVNQLLCGAHLAIAAEALSLARMLGLDMDQMLDIVTGSAASSWMLKDRGPRMLETEPWVTSAVDIFVKDLGIVLETGRDAKAALPMAALAHQLFLSVSGRGFGAFDDSQVIRAYRALGERRVS